MVELHAELLALRQQLLAFERQQAPLLEAVAESCRPSARNLLHFIAFHRHNHPGLQARLRRHGLSTLAGCDPHLLASLTTLIEVVGTLLGQAGDGAPHPGEPEPSACALAEAPDFDLGHALLHRHAERLLGHCPAVVVTLPGEAAGRSQLITDLVTAGQEEILRVCAAAHVPCIWATQVLDTLAHQGLPTRAEITDAAMGARAEALMLNKGANILDAVQSLRRIMVDSGIQRSDNSIHQKDKLLSCLVFAEPVEGIQLSGDLLAISEP